MTPNLNFIPVCETYYYISCKYFEQYKFAENWLRKNNPSFSWDILSHKYEENQEFKNICDLKRNSAYIAVVFQAMAIEGFVNLIGSAYMGDGYRKYEKKSALVKIKIIRENVFAVDEPLENGLKEKLKKLFKKRNNLVHAKPREIPLKRLTTEEVLNEEIRKNDEREFFQSLHDECYFVFDRIDEDMTVYMDLKKSITELEKETEDIVSRITNNYEEQINKTICEILEPKIIG